MGTDLFCSSFYYFSIEGKSLPPLRSYHSVVPVSDAYVGAREEKEKTLVVGMP